MVMCFFNVIQLNYAYILNHHNSGGLCREMKKVGLTTNVPLGLDVLVVVWLDETEPLLDTTFDVASALSHVAKQSSREAKIGFGVCEDL